MTNAARIVVLVFGGFICVLNFYLTFVRYRLFSLRGRQAEYRFISGFPFIGSIAVVMSLVGSRFPHWAWIAGILLAAVDTGGVHWFAGSVVWHVKRMEKSRDQ